MYAYICIYIYIYIYVVVTPNTGAFTDWNCTTTMSEAIASHHDNDFVETVENQGTGQGLHKYIITKI